MNTLFYFLPSQIANLERTQRWFMAELQHGRLLHFPAEPIDILEMLWLTLNNKLRSTSGILNAERLQGFLHVGQAKKAQ